MGYVGVIEVAMILFPFLALLMTMPYMILNYRKYGSINKLRTLIFYSFILYLLTIYLLVILPLPDPDTVHTTYLGQLNLRPFDFVLSFIKESPFVLSQPSTWLAALKHPTVYVPAFNVLMFMPFGIYLRYYFKCSFKRTLLLSALLSLFFELTQLSGLYFLYPSPYRLADIDDIIQNTTGGGIGYLLGWFALWFLPSREEIDEKAFRAGARVSGMRLCLSFMIDSMIVSFLQSFLHSPLPFWVSLCLYFALLPLVNGKTLGSALLRFALIFENATVGRTILRGVLLTLYFCLIPQVLLALMGVSNGKADSLLFLCLFVVGALAFLLFIIMTLVSLFWNRRFLFDRLSGAGYRSTVENRS